MSDRNDIIFDILKEMRDDAKSDRKEASIWRMKTDERLSSIDKIAATQTEQLKEHMRRTEIAEKRLDSLGDKINAHSDVHESVERRISTLEQPLAVKTVIKWIVACGAVAGAIVTIMKLLDL